MKPKTLATVGIVLMVLATLTSCGNTIRGIGQDTSNVGRKIARATN
ncbi:entericidin A/B family lipoprotein [Ensifer sp. LCM 4579]|nr:entericidin A/B family lipoprotein [Ensifer sp. LCM 4579]OHV77923.1 entericidin [Ensifer sp. LCM 4579]